MLKDYSVNLFPLLSFEKWLLLSLQWAVTFAYFTSTSGLYLMVEGDEITWAFVTNYEIPTIFITKGNNWSYQYKNKRTCKKYLKTKNIETLQNTLKK